MIEIEDKLRDGIKILTYKDEKKEKKKLKIERPDRSCIYLVLLPRYSVVNRGKKINFEDITHISRTVVEPKNSRVIPSVYRRLDSTESSVSSYDTHSTINVEVKDPTLSFSFSAEADVDMAELENYLYHEHLNFITKATEVEVPVIVSMAPKVEVNLSFLREAKSTILGENSFEIHGSLFSSVRSAKCSYNKVKPFFSKSHLYICRPTLEKEVVRMLLREHEDEVNTKCYQNLLDRKYITLSCLFSHQSNGKSALASKVLKNDQVCDSCEDTILWLNVGRGGKKRLISLLNKTISKLLQGAGSFAGNDYLISEFLDPIQAADAIFSIRRHYCNSKYAILVLDDVWDTEIIDAFEFTGLRLLITTRSENVVCRVGHQNTITVDEFSTNEAKDLLVDISARVESHHVMESIIGKIGTCPQAIVSVGHALKNMENWNEFLENCKNSANSTIRLRSSISMSKNQEAFYFGSTHQSYSSRLNYINETDFESEKDDEVDSTDELSDVPPLRLAAARERSRLKSALCKVIHLFPLEFYQMYSELSLFLPNTPLSVKILSTLWAVEEGAAQFIASNFESLKLLQWIGPKVYSISHDHHAACLLIKLKDPNLELFHDSAQKKMLQYLKSYDTLLHYYITGELTILDSLWSSFDPHSACNAYISQLSYLSSIDNSSRSISDVDKAIVILALCEYFHVSNCGCKAELLKLELSKLALRDNSPAELMLLTSLHFYLGSIFHSGGCYSQAIEELDECICYASFRASGTDSAFSSVSSGNDLMMNWSDFSWFEVQARELLTTAQLYEQGAAAAKKAEIFYENSTLLRANYLSSKNYLSIAITVRCWQVLGDMLRRVGAVEKAVEFYELALNQSEQSNGMFHPLRANCYEGLGKIFLMKGSSESFETASVYFDKALAINKIYFGESHPTIASSFEKQAEIRNLKDDLSGAKDLLEQCLEMRIQIFSKEHKLVGATFRLLAGVLIRELRLLSSKSAFNTTATDACTENGSFKSVNVFKIKKSDFFNVPSLTAVSMQEELFKDIAEQTEDYLQRARNILDTSNKPNAPMSPELAETMQLLYRLYMETGRIYEAEPLARRWYEWLKAKGKTKTVEFSRALTDLVKIRHYIGGAENEIVSLMYDLLAVDRVVHGEDSLKVAADQDALSNVLVEQGRHSQAEPLLRKSLQIVKEKWGSSSMEYANSLVSLGSALAAQLAFSFAEEKYREACLIKVSHLGMTHPETVDCLRSIGVLLCKQSKYEEAEQFYKRIVDADLKFFGTEKNLQVVEELNVLAVLRHAIGQFDAAEPLFRKVLELRKVLLGPNHPDVADSLLNIAALLNAKTQYSEALAMLQHSLTICKHYNGEAHPDTVSCLDRIAETYQKLRDYDEAEKIYRYALDLNINMYTENNPAVAETLSDLGELYHRTDRLQQAEDMHTRALKIRERAYGEVHETVADSCLKLSLLVNRLGRPADAEAYQKRVTQIREMLNMNSLNRTTRPQMSRNLSMGGQYRERKKDPTGYAVNKSINALTGSES